MPRPNKKQRRLLEDGQSHETEPAVDHDDDIVAGSIDDLSTDELANIFGYLSPEDIMRARLNNKMREAATKTIVPPTDFVVDNVKKYNAMAAMATALPNLQMITIFGLGDGHKWSDGEDPDDPDEEEADTHNIEIISNFRMLRTFKIYAPALNGRYPFLFNFPLLQKLSMVGNQKWDLEMLVGLPLLKELDCGYNEFFVTGNLSSLRVLKDTLEVVKILHSNAIVGNFMDLAEFPHLKELDLFRTAVTGDVREIGERDFLTLEHLRLPDGVYGGGGHEFQRISDAPDIINSLYSIKKQRPILMQNWYAKLSRDSPDRYYGEEDDHHQRPPLQIAFVQAGSRVGYKWEGHVNAVFPCEVNWLDPEPDRESSDYAKYIEELNEIELYSGIYSGFQQPPTEEEYHRLWGSLGQ